MSARANKPISVTLGPFAEKVERRMRDGEYASVSEVVRAGLRALEREDELFEEILRAKLQEALADTRPPIALDEAFDRLIAKHEARSRRDA
jgi:antitoxin ParD1/3/4